MGAGKDGAMRREGSNDENEMEDDDHGMMGQDHSAMMDNHNDHGGQMNNDVMKSKKKNKAGRGEDMSGLTSAAEEAKQARDAKKSGRQKARGGKFQ